MSNGVFTVGNYFGGVGHVSVDYGKVLKIGFRGIIDEVTRALENLDRSTSDYIKKRAVLQRRYSELSGGNQFRPSLRAGSLAPCP